MADILISGYYGFKNAGDELILKAMITDLRFYKPDVNITVLSATPNETSNEHNVCAVNRWNVFSIVKEIAKCKMLLSGSGGLFQDTTGILSLWYYLLIILTAKIFKKTVFIYATGIGEIRYSFNIFLIKKCFNNVDFITVRTEQDKKLLVSFGINKEITVTADPVFGLKVRGRTGSLDPVISIERSLSTEPSAGKPTIKTLADFQEDRSLPKKQMVGIILRKTKNWKKDVQVFSELSDLIVKNLKAEVVLIPFQLSKDIKLLNVIKNNTNVPVDIFVWNDTGQLLELFSKLYIIVSMRLHGLILAVKYKIPFVPIPRYSKIKNFLQMIGEPIYDSNEKIYSQILDKIDKNNSEKMFAVIDDLQNKSKKTAELCISGLEVREE
ncbi:MAG: polysaccharide pyruvyl transferase CsaB [Elusimicrobiota bacterium]